MMKRKINRRTLAQTVVQPRDETLNDINQRWLSKGLRAAAVGRLTVHFLSFSHNERKKRRVTTPDKACHSRSRIGAR